MQKQEYELFLNRLSLPEYLNFREDYNDYVQAVILMLDLDRKYLFEDDILKEYDAKSMDEVTSKHVNRYFHTGSLKKKNEKIKDDPFIRIWYDVYSGIYIEKSNPYYDLFFAYKLRQLDILNVDEFLSYQFEKWGIENKEMYLRFLKLVLRKYEGKLLNPATILTSIEWIRNNETQEQLSGDTKTDFKIKTKGKFKREANDGKTLLNQSQTALLIHYSMAGELFRREEYLTNSEAGLAFRILTGYDSEAMRQNLSEKNIADLKTPKNLKQLTSTLGHLIELINKDLQKK